MFATVGAVLYSARLEAGAPPLGRGDPFLLDVIGATAIGGTSLLRRQGQGGLDRSAESLFLCSCPNTLNLMNLSTFHIDMVKGGVILAAALSDVARTGSLEGLA
jgi:ribose/xylose/arabinose/galactoside ABC-type transport system permease subunit